MFDTAAFFPVDHRGFGNYLINALVIDVGGVHAPMDAEVNLDEIAADVGIEVGCEYAIDVFQAERYTDQSNFRLETSLAFTNCDPILIQ